MNSTRMRTRLFDFSFSCTPSAHLSTYYYKAVTHLGTYQIQRFLTWVIERKPIFQRDIAVSCSLMNIETSRHMLHLLFFGLMHTQGDSYGSFRKKYAKTDLLSLRSMHSDEVEGEEARRLRRNECSFYRECPYVLRVLSWIQVGL